VTTGSIQSRIRKLLVREARNRPDCERGIMKRLVLSVAVLVVALFVSVPASYAQGGAKTGPDPSTLRDAELEKDSLHNLEVARHYFKQKKAYVAAIKRCEEIDAGNPNFAKMDEVLFIAGASSLRLAETGGKQKTKVVMPDSLLAKDKSETQYKSAEDLRSDARVYFSRLVADYPNSVFRKQAEDELAKLGGPLKPGEEPVSTQPPPELKSKI
jgi:outer membrane protein assembly factor BamD (BamD/ComL family)